MTRCVLRSDRSPWNWARALVATAAFTVSACSMGGGATSTSEQAGRLVPGVRLSFDERGEAALPRGYRSWVHVSTAWDPITTTILDGSWQKTPEFLSVYVEPKTYRAYMETGRWPDGALIVKEFSFNSVDPKNCGGPPAFVCMRWYGKGIFEHGYIGIGVMLKDKARFPKEPGNWAYFSYGHQAPPYQERSPARSRQQCAQCHIDHVPKEDDFVFSDFHIGLNRTGTGVRDNLAASLPVEPPAAR